MDNWIVGMMLSASLFLGAIALIAFLWGIKNGQFDDEEKFLNSALYDTEEDLAAAIAAEKKKDRLKKEAYKPE